MASAFWRALVHVLEDVDCHPLGIAHDACEAVPLAGLEREHPDVAVLAREDRGGRAERHADAGAALELAVLRVAADVLAADEGRGDRLGARDVDVLAAADALAAVDRGQAPGRRRDRAVEVGGERAVLERRLAGPAAVAAARAREMEGVQVGSRASRQ